MPLVSVVLPVYNSKPYVFEALNSILNQTLTDIEIIAIDDGSSDGSADCITKCVDPRIRFFQNLRNMGVVYTLNRAINLGESPFVAIMNSDDIAAPNRLQSQLAAARDTRSDVVGGSMRCIQDQTWSWTVPTADADLRATMLIGMPFPHPTLFCKRDVYASNLYSEEFWAGAEDYDFLCRANVAQRRFCAIEEPVLSYRVHKEQMSARFQAEQTNNFSRANRKYCCRMGFGDSVDAFMVENSLAIFVRKLSESFPGMSKNTVYRISRTILRRLKYRDAIKACSSPAVVRSSLCCELIIDRLTRGILRAAGRGR